MKSPDQVAFKAILVITMIIAVAMLPFAVRAEAEKPHGPPAFAEIDVDGDGFISEEELNSFRAARMAAMAEAGKPMKGAATAPAFGDIDTDGDGRVNEAELTAAQQAHHKSMHEQDGKGRGRGKGMHNGKGMHIPTFVEFDLNGDGCIDVDEFARHQAEMHGNSQTD